MICKKCRKDLPADAFYASNKSRCKECVRAKVSAYRVENIERVRAYDRMRGLLPRRKEAVKTRQPKYRDAHAESNKQFRAKNPEKYKAHSIVNAAIRDGALTVQPCERCGDAIGVQAHHDDYSKPLDVMWLCPKHHGERHRELNEQRRRGAA